MSGTSISISLRLHTKHPGCHICMPNHPRGAAPDCCSAYVGEGGWCIAAENPDPAASFYGKDALAVEKAGNALSCNTHMAPQSTR